MKYLVRIHKGTGSLEFLGAPPPRLELPAPVRRRFSEIVPRRRWPRLAFRVLRRVFGEQGRVAEWTRAWKVEWLAIILLGKFRGAQRVDHDRARLVTWEQELWRTQ